MSLLRTVSRGALCARIHTSVTSHMCAKHSESASMIKVNDRIPCVTLYDGSPTRSVTTEQLCKSRTVIMFGTPGAFTPACSQTHLPGYVQRADKLKLTGVDEIVCVTVNDPFVTAAWSKDQQAEGKVRVLSDTHGQLSRSLGLQLDLTAVLGSWRCRRFSMLLNDGVVQQLNVEPDGKGLSCSLAEVLAQHLKNK